MTESGPLVNIVQRLKENRDRILAIGKEYGVVQIRIFGSVARNEADEESDIDFLVDLEPGCSLFDLSGFLVDVESLLGYSVDAVTEKGLKPRIKAHVLKEVRPL